MNITFPDSVKRCVDLQTNGDLSLYTDMPETFYLDSYLRDFKPKKALDIGCGVGRASVYFFKKYFWNATYFYLADGNTCERRYKGIRKNQNEFYNDRQATIDFCTENGLEHFRFINLEVLPILNAVQNIALAYSFLAVGFHWPIGFYLQTLSSVCTKGALVLFGIRSEPESWIMEQIKSIDKDIYKIAELKLCPRETRRSVLVLEVL